VATHSICLIADKLWLCAPCSGIFTTASFGLYFPLCGTWLYRDDSPEMCCTSPVQRMVVHAGHPQHLLSTIRQSENSWLLMAVSQPEQFVLVHSLKSC